MILGKESGSRERVRGFLVPKVKLWVKWSSSLYPCELVAVPARKPVHNHLASVILYFLSIRRSSVVFDYG